MSDQEKNEDDNFEKAEGEESAPADIEPAAEEAPPADDFDAVGRAEF